MRRSVRTIYQDREEKTNLPARELDRRRKIAALVLFFLLAILVGQLFNLQVVKGEKFLELSKRNCLMITPIPAPRGEIVDRDGEVLVTSRPSYNVLYWYVNPSEAEQTLDRLAEILGMDPSVLQRRIRDYSGRYFEPILLVKDLSPEQCVKVAEHAPEIPGVFIDVQPVRYYPGGTLAAPVLGYVGEISSSQLKSERFKGYKIGDIVGQEGLESYYEPYLKGTPGGYQVEVDYRGRPTGNVGPGVPPEPGKTLVLEMSASLQRVCEEALTQVLQKKPKAKAGVAVVIDVKTGGILAMASVPGFDPNRLIQGISYRELTEVLSTGQWRFLNLAISGLYPPGSCFKVVTAVAALQEGAVTPGETFVCKGYHPMAPTLGCWQKQGHGRVNLEDALGQSCNVFFYELGRRLGTDTIAKYALQMGLGQKTGVDLFGEAMGTVPTSAWKEKAYSEGRVSEPELLLSEHMMVAMGQVFHMYTPLQMAIVAQTIANDGVRMKPRMVKAIVDADGRTVKEFPPEVAENMNLPAQVIDEVKRGMLKVTQKGGTAYWSFYDFPVPVAGKTGTAENPLGETHAWFIGFAPYESPEIAVAVLIDQGGGGSEVAAPVARAIFQEYFKVTPLRGR
ncbi:MAG TPA: penicillin-binding protein 2 [Firmicutes bacterium]|nr:penicillin-binding protein 2 [Candidatus Fermentithermobacillaceae bacterium]